MGGVPEYAEDGKNSLLYRFEDYEVLAEHIIRLFEDQELRKKLSENERASIAVLEKRPAGYKHMRRIYRECIERKGGIMKIVFLTNYLTHHQVEFCDILYNKTKGYFWLVSTRDVDQEQKNLDIVI